MVIICSPIIYNKVSQVDMLNITHFVYCYDCVCHCRLDQIFFNGFLCLFSNFFVVVVCILATILVMIQSSSLISWLHYKFSAYQHCLNQNAHRFVIVSSACFCIFLFFFVFLRVSYRSKNKTPRFIFLWKNGLLNLTPLHIVNIQAGHIKFTMLRLEEIMIMQRQSGIN